MSAVGVGSGGWGGGGGGSGRGGKEGEEKKEVMMLLCWTLPRDTPDLSTSSLIG